MKNLFLAFLASFLISGCIYNPSDEPFTKVRKPSASGAYVNLDNISGQPQGLYTKTSFSLSISPAGREYYQVTLYLDDQYLYSSESNSNYFDFELDPADFSDGLKELKAVISYSSGNGSLADRAGLEMITIEKKWSILIDSVPPQPIADLQVLIEDGKLMLKWTKPTKENFLQYIITRKYHLTDGTIISESFPLSNVKISSFHDAYYVGGNVSYEVDINGYQFYVEGTTTSFNCVPLEVSFVEEYPAPYFNYSTSILYNNLIDAAWYNSGLFTTRSPSFSGTVSIPNLKFGEIKPIDIKVYPRVTNPYNLHHYKIVKEAYLGKKMVPYNTLGSVRYSEQLKSYFLANGNSIYRIDDVTMAVTDTLIVPASFEFIVSPNAEQAYIMYLDRKVFSKLDLETLTITETFNVSEILGFSANAVWKQVGFNYGLTDNNYFYCDTFDSQLLIADLTNKKSIWQFVNPGSNKHCLSNDGKFLVFGYYVFKRSDSEEDVTYTLSSLLPTLAASATIMFKPNNDIHVFTSNGTLRAYDPDVIADHIDQVPPYKITIGMQINSMTYDKYSNTFGGFHSASGSYNIFNGDDFTLIRTLPSKTGTIVSLKYLNGTYFHQAGLYLKLP